MKYSGRSAAFVFGQEWLPYNPFTAIPVQERSYGLFTTGAAQEPSLSGIALSSFLALYSIALAALVLVHYASQNEPYQK
ncbi:hypothetical protein [Paenibacillus provencensis]|uniref:hypothetical protein n=1 Tax=Paenibacillus provencensis TaxID=441151 RepID=UPI0036D43B25